MFHSVGRQFNVITFHILQNKLCSNIPVLLAAEAKIDFFFYFIKIRDQYGSPLTALSLSLSFSRSLALVTQVLMWNSKQLQMYFLSGAHFAERPAHRFYANRI